MNKKYKIIFAVFFCFFIFSNIATGSTKPVAKTPPLEITGWIPYWRVATGTADALAHIDLFSEISPFGFSVKSDGTLQDLAGIATTSSAWQTLIQTARQKNIKIIPSIMWSDGDSIDTVLRSKTLRKNHIDQIINLLNTYGFDGIDIDYESKKDVTINYFSLFLKELYARTGKRLVVCTIEPRTPLDSRFVVVPKDITYANDFSAINKYCDRVRIMAYDQGRIDLKLNKTTKDPYNPVADLRWVEKVITLASKTISKKKIYIGIPTYGHEFEVTPTTNGYTYNFVTSFNPQYALAIASMYGVSPIRNLGGEMTLVYTPTSTPMVINNVTQVTNPSVMDASSTAKALVPTSVQLLTWSDSLAVRDKFLLAKKLGVRGVSIFKIDGAEDPDIWTVLKQ